MTARLENFALMDKTHGFPTYKGQLTPQINKENSPPIDWVPFMKKVLSRYNNLKVDTLVRSSTKSDSGYFGSSEGRNTSKPSKHFIKSSRWTKMSESLLHVDTKSFLKKNFPSPQSETHQKRSPLFTSAKKVSAFADINSDDDDEFNGKMLKKMIYSPRNLKSDITKNLLLLCESISEYINMVSVVDIKIFGFDTIKVDLKSAFMMLEPSQLLPQVLSLVNRFNLNDLSRLIYEMEVLCAVKDLPLDNFEAGCAELNTSIDLLRTYAMKYSSDDSVFNSKAFIKVIRHACRTFASIATRLWINCCLINNA